MTREEAFKLMIEHTPSESLRNHMLGVESCMKWYAEFYAEPSEPWQIAGLLHDFDYELHPDEHPLWGMELLRHMGVDETIVRAIAAHYPPKTGIEPESLMERSLFACDELSGFITACCYVRPEKINGLTPKSVLKKLRTANFAAGVNRDDVHRGAELLNLELSQHIQNCIDAMTQNASTLGLMND
ncbi:MAG: HD domain-containing protein [Fimbriimonadaceae bacterium]